MKAALSEKYGSLVIRDLPNPEPGEGEIVVRVNASSVNAADWYEYAGRPYVGRAMMGLRTPKSSAAGKDFAGVVESVGAGVEHLSPGDEVYGIANGAYAELVTAKNAVARKPANLSFEKAAAVPLAALTALQGLRDHGGLSAGQRVLVNGASGGVGIYAVQIAKAFGATVHAVCSTRNVEQARELGADRVFDYTREDFTRSGERYHLLFDNAGTRSWLAMRRVLAPNATVVLVGGPRKRALGPLGHTIRIALAAKANRKAAAFFVAKPNRDDLEVLTGLIEAGQLRPVIEQRFELEGISDAMRAMDGHTRAKIVVTVG